MGKRKPAHAAENAKSTSVSTKRLMAIGIELMLGVCVLFGVLSVVAYGGIDQAVKVAAEQLESPGEASHSSSSASKKLKATAASVSDVTALGASKTASKKALGRTAKVSVTAKSINKLPKGAAVESFSVSADNAAPKLGGAQKKRIQKAVDRILAQGSCSFILLNIRTGCGVTYDRNQKAYVASAIKAPYACYLLQTGKIKGKDDDAGMASLLEASVVSSDNEAFEVLREAYGHEGFAEWMEGFGADAACAGDAYYFYPDCSATDMAKTWLQIRGYMAGKSAGGAWLKELLGQTNISFIRTGLAKDKATVLNKAGWIADAEDGWNATNDAALITGTDTDELLMVIMTGQPHCTQAEDNVAELASALYATRAALR